MAKAWLIAAALMLLIPVASLAAMAVSNGALEGEWRTALEAKYGPIPAGVQDQVTLKALCASPADAADLGQICEDLKTIGDLRLLDLAAIALSGAIVIVALVIAAVGRGSGLRMALLFRPALLLVVAATAVLLVMQGVSLVGSVYFTDVALNHHYYPWFLIVLSIGALVSVGGALQAMPLVLRPRPRFVPALALRRTTDVTLYDEVADVARLVGVEPPSTILAGLQPNFWVVEAPIDCLDGLQAGRTLYVSMPGCRMLSRDEFRAVIAHELAHFRAQDTAYTRRVGPALAAARTAISSLMSADNRLLAGSVPPAIMLNAVVGTFEVSVRSLGRAREFAADAAGASVTSPADMGSALTKMDLAASQWAITVEAVKYGILNQAQIDNIADEVCARTKTEAERRAGLGAEPPRPPKRSVAKLTPTHPFDTHPPTADRVAALGLDPATAMGGVPNLAPADPATGLFGDVLGIEQELTDWMDANAFG